MAKEFDICLRGRIFEGNLLVTSLPFRDGITAANGMILYNSVNGYVLAKSFTGVLDHALDVRIDHFLKTDYEQVDSITALDSDAIFQLCLSNRPNKAEINICVDDMPMLIMQITNGNSGMAICAPTLNAMIGKSIGYGESSIGIDAIVDGSRKTSFIQSNIEINPTASIETINKRSMLKVIAPVCPYAELSSLGYLMPIEAKHKMELAALVLGTELHFSFGLAYFNLSLECAISNEHMTKYETSESALNVSAILMEFATKRFSIGNAMNLSSSVSPVLKRYRLLEEMSEETLDTLAEMTLEDLIYVIY